MVSPDHREREVPREKVDLRALRAHRALLGLRD